MASMAPVEQVFKDFCKTIGFPVDESSLPTFKNPDPLTNSVHRIGDAMSVALAAMGSEMATIWKARSGKEETVTVNGYQSLAQLMACFFNSTNGVHCMRHINGGDKSLLGLNDFYKTKDGKWLYLVNIYAHLRNINLSVLKCGPQKDQVTEAILQWNGIELEETIAGLGGCACVVRTPEEFREHPLGKYLANVDLVTIEKLGDTEPQPFPALSEQDNANGKPLGGLKVLDFTHVFAGPLSARFAAEHGAEVLNTNLADKSDFLTLCLETMIGKRNAFCDLNKKEDVTALFNLLSESDVFVSSWLNLAEKGLDHATLVNHRPGLVIVDYHAFGAEGPWKVRGGLDQLATAVSGFSYVEGGSDGGKPKLPPTDFLNDYLAGVLGVTGMVECLRRRATEGGSWRVRVNLTGVCMWVQSMGIYAKEEVEHLEGTTVARLGPHLEYSTVAGPYGNTTFCPTQLHYDTGSIKRGCTRGAEPNGASPLTWATK